MQVIAVKMELSSVYLRTRAIAEKFLNSDSKVSLKTHFPVFPRKFRRFKVTKKIFLQSFMQMRCKIFGTTVCEIGAKPGPGTLCSVSFDVS